MKRYWYIPFVMSFLQLTALDVRAMPVEPTPESSTVVLVIAAPKKGQFVSNPVKAQFRIDGYALGAASQFERADEIVLSPLGQSIHVVIDNNPYFAIIGQAIDPFNENGNYYDTSYTFTVPFALDSGIHTMRMFPARSYGESLKGENTFHAVQFYTGDNDNGLYFDLTQPFITYNEPSNQLYLEESKPILLDFYVNNADLSPNGFKVRLSIDGKVIKVITSWQPYYLYGLQSGRHSVRLELLNPQNQTVPGYFNDVEQIIFVH